MSIIWRIVLLTHGDWQFDSLLKYDYKFGMCVR